MVFVFLHELCMLRGGKAGIYARQTLECCECILLPSNLITIAIFLRQTSLWVYFVLEPSTLKILLHYYRILLSIIVLKGFYEPIPEMHICRHHTPITRPVQTPEGLRQSLFRSR